VKRETEREKAVSTIRLVAVGGVVFSAAFTVYMDSIGALAHWLPTLLAMLLACARLWALRRWAVLALILFGVWQITFEASSLWQLQVGWIAWTTAVIWLFARYRAELQPGF